MSNTPNYIKSLLTPNGKSPAGRRVWSIDQTRRPAGLLPLGVSSDFM